ncbi:MAG: MFS transporter [Planctomycetes bacterium]|nr:MFS transporter [Planctomycetota bacterium]
MSSPAPTPAAASARRAFGQAYWMLNSIEMFERLAYFGIRAVVPLYIMQATEPGGLHLSAVNKGVIYMWWAILQSWLPMFTGGIADRYGYKRVLCGAILANSLGYVMMAFLHSHAGFFAGVLVLAAGTAFFKPALQGSIAQNLTRANSSMGWGIFYWVVNVGAVLAPILATAILGKPHSAEGWRNLFVASALYTAVNLLLLVTFRDVPSGSDKTLGIGRVFARTVENIWPYWFVGGTLHPRRGPLGIVLAGGGLALFVAYQTRNAYAAAIGGALFFGGALLTTWLRGGQFQWQLRLPAFLLILSCFWMMMYQLWDLHPNFITDWVDSSAVAAHAPGAWREYGDRGLVQVPQQILLNLNAALIVLLIVPVSYVARKMRTLSAMLVGMSVATVGVLVAGLTQSGWVLLLGIVFFSLGEMWTGPKKNEYLGLIAPPGKKGLYLGYVNIPIGVGVGLGSWLAGLVYDNYGEKATLALKELGARPPLVAQAAPSIDWSDALHRLPALMDIAPEEAFVRAQEQLGLDAPNAAETLLRYYRHDSGQTVNLACLHLATELDSTARAVAVRRGRDPTPLARRLHELPGWMGVKRAEAFDLAREAINAGRPAAERLSDSEIVAWLWERYGDDPHVRDNLALEYLAQATPLLHDAIERRLEEQPLVDPVQELEERFGIGRTKSFAALSAALGAGPDEVDAALDALGGGTNREERLYVYLASQPHVRFLAVAKRDWTRDVPLLQEMIDGSPAARQVVEQRIDDALLDEAILSAVLRLFGRQPPTELHARLAEEQWLIQEALAAKDWAAHPEHARKLLGLGVPEARARAAIEIGNAAVATTARLWDTYHPQYKVWLPFAAIGVLATIALAIFGQRAKRWQDMNA